MCASFISLFAVIMVAAADTSSRQLGNRISHAEDVGALHTDAFEKLAEMYAVKKPARKKDMMKDSFNILTSYCDKDTSDSECETYAKGATKEQFKMSAVRPYKELSYPEDTLDPKLQKSLAKVNSIVAALKSSNDIDETVFHLAAVKREVEDMDDVKEEEKLVVLSAISVASESSKLWHKVYNDPNHILHGMHLPTYYSDNKGKRRLEDWENEEGWNDDKEGEGDEEWWNDDKDGEGDGGWWNDDKDGEGDGGWWNDDKEGEGGWWGYEGGSEGGNGGNGGNGMGMGIDLFAVISADISGALSGAMQHIDSGDVVSMLTGALMSAVPASMAAVGGGDDGTGDGDMGEGDEDGGEDGEEEDGEGSNEDSGEDGEGEDGDEEDGEGEDEDGEEDEEEDGNEDNGEDGDEDNGEDGDEDNGEDGEEEDGDEEENSGK